MISDVFCLECDDDASITFDLYEFYSSSKILTLKIDYVLVGFFTGASSWKLGTYGNFWCVFKEFHCSTT